jgi:hypothetical protein
MPEISHASPLVTCVADAVITAGVVGRGTVVGVGVGIGGGVV